jgi:hypothetical protein
MMRTTKLKPPVVRQALQDVSARVWGHRPLGMHIAELERLLMVDADAPIAFDCIPLRATRLRGKALVDVCARSFSANPALNLMIKRVGGALREDLSQRAGMTADVGMQEAVDKISRQVEVKPSYRPR